MNSRRGFSIFELLVVIGVLFILTALLIPAVAAVGGRARSMRCSANLRQIGVGLGAYHADFHVFPPGSLSSVALPNNSVILMETSPFAAMLPQLGFEEVFASLNFNGGASKSGGVATQYFGEGARRSIPIFQCPSDGRGPPSKMNYRVCLGAIPCRPFRNSIDGPFDLESGRTTADFLDGLSKSILVAERSVSSGELKRLTIDRDIWRFSYPTDGSLPTALFSSDGYAARCSALPTEFRVIQGVGWSWVHSGLAYTAYNHVLLPNSEAPDCTGTSDVTEYSAVSARSRHSGFVNVLYGDGSAGAIGNPISITVWRSFATINGGESTPSIQ